MLQLQLSPLHTHTDYWEERANKVLSHFRYTNPDEIDLYDICWRYGVKIMPLDLPFVYPYINNTEFYESISHLKAFSIPRQKSRRGTIFLKPCLDAIEKKLLLAEEFCHIYSHQASQLVMDKHGIAKNENQAKKMAAYLLMPEHFLKNVYTVGIDEAVIISEIADYFVVTEEFAQYRLELIYNRRVDAFWNIGGKLGTVEWL